MCVVFLLREQEVTKRSGFIKTIFVGTKLQTKTAQSQSPKFFTVTPSIFFGLQFSIDLFHVIHLEPRILRWILDLQTPLCK